MEKRIIEKPLDEADQRSIYIPFLSARNYIAKMEDDIGSMYHKHSTIFEELQGVYKLIEEESQQRFINHVKNLRTKYDERISFHKRVIDSLRRELKENAEKVTELETLNNEMLKEHSAEIEAALLEKNGHLTQILENKNALEETKATLESKIAELQHQLHEAEIKLKEGVAGYRASSRLPIGQEAGLASVPVAIGVEHHAPPSQFKQQVADVQVRDSKADQPAAVADWTDALQSINEEEDAKDKSKDGDKESKKKTERKIDTGDKKLSSVKESPQGTESSKIRTASVSDAGIQNVAAQTSAKTPFMLEKELENIKRQLQLSNHERDSAQNEVLALRAKIEAAGSVPGEVHILQGKPEPSTAVKEKAKAPQVQFVPLTPLDTAPRFDANKYEEDKRRHEQILLELEKKYDEARKKLKEQDKILEIKEDEIIDLKSKMTKLNIDANLFNDLQKQLRSLQSENAVLFKKYSSEMILRKKYYNQVEDMKGKIRVYIRVRPISVQERNRGNKEVVRSPDEFTIELDTHNGLKKYQFDHIFMPEDSQASVFEDTRNLIQSAMDGYNVCIIAYGQTGSGKTYTMDGDTESGSEVTQGLSPRAFKRIFEIIGEKSEDYKFSVSVYMIENYMDKLIDLLRTSNSSDQAKLEPKLDARGMVYVPGIEVKQANSENDLQSIFEFGKKRRHVASTKMNEESSRSHLILSILIESENIKTGNIVSGKLSLVDLAGSERSSKTEATGQQFKEANEINKSLSTLGNVISALGSKDPPGKHIYRQSTLTMLLQDSLGGNAKTLMFINLSPVDYNASESNSSLTFAAKVKNVTNQAQKNTDTKEVVKLRAIIDKLKRGESVEDY